MFTIDLPLSELDALISETKAAGGDAIRFTIHGDHDEVPYSFTTCGLIRPNTELDAGSGSYFPADRL